MTHFVRTLIILFFVTSVHGQELPANAQDLHKSYQKALKKAIEPVTNVYIRELTRLKNQAIKENDLKAALAIDEELIRVQLGIDEPNIGLGAITKKRLTQGITTYELTRNNYKIKIKFNPDGTVSMHPKYFTTWQLTDHKLHIKGSVYWHDFDSRPKLVNGKLILIETDSSEGKREDSFLILGN